MPAHWVLAWSRTWVLASLVLSSSTSTSGMSNDQVAEVHTKCVSFLKTRVSYCWKKQRGGDPLKWGLGTWSNRTSRSSIEKNGTSEDIAKLGPATNRNKSKPVNQKRNWPLIAHPLYYGQRQRVNQARQSGRGSIAEGSNPPPGNDTFASQFENVADDLGERLAQRSEQAQTAANTEVAQEIEQARQAATRGRAGGLLIRQLTEVE